MDPMPDSELQHDDDQYTSTFVFSGQDSACMSDPTDAELERLKSDGSQAADRIRAFYSSGVPFFTKDAIADLVAQLDRARQHFQHESTRDGDKKDDSHVDLLRLQALDGKLVEVKNELGTAWQQGCKTEQVMVDFVIHYETYQHLIVVNNDPRQFVAKLAYCPLTVRYHAQSRFTDTNVFRPAPKSKPFEITHAAFHAGVKAWEDSEECKKLRTSLMATTIPDKITKIIAFACCTISSGRPISEDSIKQHALMLTIKEILQKKSLDAHGEIKPYAQDPVYKDVDKAVLGAAGIHILDDPYGFLEVNDSSIVISFAPNVPVRQIIADIARPAIVVWDRVKSEGEIIQSWSKEWSKNWKKENLDNSEDLEGTVCDPESSRLRKMIEDQYIETNKLSGQTFGDSCVYVRRC